MGQRNSTHFKDIKSSQKNNKNSNEKTKVVKKCPMPVEAYILRQITEKYQNHSKMLSANNPTTHLYDIHLEGGVIGKDDLSKMIIPPYYPDEGEKEPIQIPLEEFVIERIMNQMKEQKKAEEARRRGNEVVCEKEGFKITDFPALIVEKILEFLSPSNILALRATCSQMKAWVDKNPFVLENLEMRLEPEICDYNTNYPYTSPWSNLAIPYIRLHSSFVNDAVADNGENIWRLEIFAPKCINSTSTNYPANHPRRLFKIINMCPRLQHLSICRIDTLTELGSYEYPHLRVLQIDRIQWMNHSDFHIFENLIMKCPNLEYLKMPEYEILGSLAFIFYDAQASPEKEHLIRPLIRYMETYRSDSSQSRRYQSKLYIDVLEFEDFKLCSSDVFYELSRKCIESNAVLMNVYFVPRDAVYRNQQDIVESFASMFGFIKIDFEAELWKNLEVMECWIEDFPDDFDLTMRQLSFLRTISKIRTLRSLTIRLSVEEPYVCSAALEACVGEKYSSIQKLILRRHHINPDNQVRIPEGFGVAFSNVKYLYFQELDSKNEDFRHLWSGMPNLEELFVYKCPYLTQDAFIRPSPLNDNGIGEGEDGTEAFEEEPILSLKKLQLLVIFLYDGVGGFDDMFISKALRFMRLKGFALRGATGVEFTEAGMMSLLNSPFHDTIEDFEAPSSCFRPALSSNYWHFYVSLPKKQLRRNRIWLSCSVLLNSLSSRKHPYDFKRRCLGI